MTDLALRDAIADTLHLEHVVYGWRLMTLESLHLLAAAHQREQSLEAQLSALRVEVRDLREQRVVDSIL